MGLSASNRQLTLLPIVIVRSGMSRLRQGMLTCGVVCCPSIVGVNLAFLTCSVSARCPLKFSYAGVSENIDGAIPFWAIAN